MLESLNIKNFQSHEDTTVEFAPTVTAIIGSNNHGKSAVIRALQKVMRDTPLGNAFVRDDTKECSITLTANGKAVTRNVRTTGASNSNEYVVEGIEFNKFGAGGIPVEVLEALQVSNVQAFGDVVIDLNFQHQLDDPFLVKGSGLPSLRGKVLGRVTGVDKAQRAVQLANTDSKRASTQSRNLESDIVDIDSKLKDYEDFGKIRVQFERFEQDVDAFSSDDVDLQSKVVFLDKINNIVKDAKALKGVLKSTENTLQEDIGHVNTLVECQQKLERLSQITATMQGVEAKAAVSTDVSIDEIQDIQQELSLMEELHIVDFAVKAVNILLATTHVPDASEIERLEASQQHHVGYWKKHTELQGRMEKVVLKEKEYDDELGELHEELHVLEDELGVCPLCERSF